MQHCLDLAQKAIGQVAPNPLVGCVIVKDEKIIGEGYHEHFGLPHAEVNAINAVKDKSMLRSATLYANLEPCAHYGKTPPCVDLIIYHKIPYVVIGCLDPNPLVSSKGIEKLVKSGCDVKIGILEDECKDLNKRFFTWHEKKRPYIILKWAQSKDGFIAPQPTQEKLNEITWISNEASRKLTHKWRSEEQAIMVGTATAIQDDPKLNVRLWKGSNPIRVVLDRNLRIPANYHLLDNTIPTLVFTSKAKQSKNNLEFIRVNFEKDVIPQVLSNLYERNIQSLIVEGGTQLLNSFIKDNLWDEARMFTSGKKLADGVKAPVWDRAREILSEENMEGDLLVLYRNRG